SPRDAKIVVYMKKIRINELARELEVKAHEILERLPELGVTEKKTHSSSVDEDVAIKLRALYGVAEPRAEQPAEEAESTQPAAPPAPVSVPSAAAPVEKTAEPSAAPAEAEEKRPAAEETRPAGPVRPPLATGRPVHPPLGAPGQTPPAVVFTPGRPAPPAPKPLPTTPAATGPKPGQILSGPRQPFPSAPAETARPGTPAPPAPPRQTVAPPRPRPGEAIRPPAASSAPSPAATPGAPSAGPGRTLAGQPAARPVVPPRPDLVAKLGTPRPAMPAGPGAPRPGAPRPPSSPVPGQPIYRGPIRPGQPLVARTGVRPGLPPRPGGPRPQHPTSRGRMDPGLAPPPIEQPRGRPGQRPVRGQPRERVEEEKILRPASRRQIETGPPPINREITISEGITVKELSEKLDVKANLVIKKLLDKNIFATINQTLDSKLATDLAREFGASTATVTYEEEAMQA